MENINMSSLELLNISTNEIEIQPDIPMWATVLSISFLSLFSVIGIFGNGLILIVQWCNKDRSSTDILVFTMAIFEFICSGFNMPFIAIRDIRFVWASFASTTFCRIHKYSLYFTSIATTLLLASIAVDRYIRTCLPLSGFYTKKKAKLISIGIAIFSLSVTVPVLTNQTLAKKQLTCKSKTGTQTVTALIQLSAASSFAIMFLIVVFCYTKVSLMLRRRHRKKNRIGPVLTYFSRKRRENAKSHTNGMSTRQLASMNFENVTNSLFLHDEPTCWIVNLDDDSAATANKIDQKDNHLKIVIKHSEKFKGVDKAEEEYEREDTEERESEIQRNRKHDTLTVEEATDDIIEMSIYESDSITQQQLPFNSDIHEHCSNDLGADGNDVNVTSKFDYHSKSFCQNKGSLEKDKQVSGDKPNGFPRTENRRTSHSVEDRQLFFKEELRRLNRTTVIMFLITIVYILSWSVYWIVSGIVSPSNYTGYVVRYLFKYVYTINCMANPIFFILMSSRFRSKAKDLPKRLTRIHMCRHDF